MLDLTDSQQVELAKLLANQREQIRRLWSDGAVAPEFRVSAMRAISDKTEEQIRALLNDEQKKKYVLPRATDSPDPSQQSTLEYWLNASKPSQRN